MSLAGLQGKVAVVTGAAGGIGAASARRLSREGARVVCVDIDGDAAERVAAGLESPAVAVVADTSDAAATDNYIGAATQHFGRIDLLHANAGILGPVAPLVSMAEADFDRVIQINLRGVFLAVRAAMRAMSGQGGAIVVTSSIVGLRGAFGSAAYAAAKHGVLGVARTAAIEGGSQGIRVNAICPGAIETPMLDTLRDLVSPGDRDRGAQMLRAGTPLGRDGSPEEIAAAVAWMLSEDASFLTGAVLAVDGGATAG